MSLSEEVLLTARCAAAARRQKSSGVTSYRHDDGVLQGWYVTTTETWTGDTWSARTEILLTPAGDLYSLYILEVSYRDTEDRTPMRKLTKIDKDLPWPESQKREVIHRLRLLGQA
jgi:hypothetical protein